MHFQKKQRELEDDILVYLKGDKSKFYTEVTAISGIGLTVQSVLFFLKQQIVL